MTATFALIMAAFAIVQIWLLSRAVDALEARHDARLKALEQGRKQEPTKVHVPDYLKPVENFEPKKPETLRPKEVKGREAGENVFEFDVKVN
jgi:hypothetical protein